jgi:ABC-type transport system involved in multi-copper enzyme maturation permease subunit
MRPYLAIIKDSFRAAWASKVLYVLLALITLLLLAIAPLHYRQTIRWKLIASDHIEHFGSIGQRLIDNAANEDRRQLKRIWNAFPAGFRDDLIQTLEKQNRPNTPPTKRSLEIFRELIGELNNIIAQPDFFQTADLTSFELDTNMTESLQSDGQTREQLNLKRRANRAIIAQIFSPFIQLGDTTTLSAYYGPWPLDFLDAFAASETQFASGVAAYIPSILDKFVLSIGLAIAIVVTASIIPETFEPGSLNLLLSKPISRSGLFVAKFIGGCVFISICATYLFSGVWLWLGLALGIWEHAILLSILLYIIVFGIYFSVSALVGLIYRSTILAIMVTLFFWVACFLVGTSHGFLDTHLQNSRIVKLNQSNGTVLSLDRMSQLAYWDNASALWVAPYSPEDASSDRSTLTAASWMGDLEEFPLPLGPLRNPVDRRWVAGRTSMSNMFTFGQQELLTSAPGGGPLLPRGNFPRGTIDFLQGTNALIAITGEGNFFRFSNPTATPSTEKQQTAPKSSSDTASPPNGSTTNKHFISVGPDRPAIVANRGACAINSQNDQIAIYGNRVISVYRLRPEGYAFDRSIEVETDAPDSMSALLAYQGDTLLLALGNGQLISLDGKTMQERFGYRPQRHHATEDLIASPDGRWFFVTYRDGSAWVLDQQNPATMTVAPFSGQGSISAIGFSDTNEVLVADRVNQVTRYQLPDFSPTQSFRPQDGTLEHIYYWVIRPLYSIWPKPGEFYKVVEFMANGGPTDAPNEIDLRLRPRYRNPWAPLTSGLAFMAAMVGLSCVYFWRKDY